MERINRLQYKNNGLTITFKECPFGKNELVQKFSPFIEGNDELTKKLLASVRTKKVKEKDIFRSARSLFKIIEKNDFIPIHRGEEISILFEKFQKSFEQNPKFNIENLSTVKGGSLFSARLIVEEVPFTTGKGRTKQEAKASALNILFSTFG